MNQSKPGITSRTTRSFLAALAFITSAPGMAHAATTPQEQLGAYAASAGVSAGAAANVERGQAFFTSRHGREWSCSTCHGAVPTQEGKHTVTGKAISPMAPAFNPTRFTDAGKTEKWFRRNCNDVVGRECTPAEKADLISWLISLKP
jgi:hypothetical protein